MRRVAIFPGTFDPLTNGHLDLISRGSRLFDHLIVAVLQNTTKSPLFDTEERKRMIAEAAAHIPNVEVASFGGLLIDYVTLRDAPFVLRGIRDGSDYDNEFQMALLNRSMRPETETVFLMTDAAHSFISSSRVREIATLGGDVSAFVPAPVLDGLRSKIQSPKLQR